MRFAADVLACLHCSGRLRLIATLDTSDTTRPILRPSPCQPRCWRADARPPPDVGGWALNIVRSPTLAPLSGRRGRGVSSRRGSSNADPRHRHADGARQC